MMMINNHMVLLLIITKSNPALGFEPILSFQKKIKINLIFDQNLI
jgi:hypothetical protein